ncbi:MAG: hypothetical protein EBR42_02600 [Betaproteobacteria bacterium]|jgi:hypothetical protein|nr:hypothetical protein [Betaproteobacteria bacterium]
METALGLLLAYFVVLGMSLVFRKHTVRGPWLFLFRAFFPNWQFFHKVGPVPHLYVRFQDTTYQWSDWEWVYPRRYRQLLDVFHNPSGNLLLAQQNLVDHLSSDIKDLGEGADARPLVSYQLVCRLAAQAARVSNGQGLYQFELRLERPTPQGYDHSDTVLRSPELPL